MPLRSELFRKCWPNVNPPTAPFLAPRIPQPWPCSPARAYSGAAAADIGSNHDAGLPEPTQHESIGVVGGLTSVRESCKVEAETQTRSQSYTKRSQDFSPIGWHEYTTQTRKSNQGPEYRWWRPKGIGSLQSSPKTWAIKDEQGDPSANECPKPNSSQNESLIIRSSPFTSPSSKEFNMVVNQDRIRMSQSPPYHTLLELKASRDASSIRSMRRRIRYFPRTSPSQSPQLLINSRRLGPARLLHKRRRIVRFPGPSHSRRQLRSSSESGDVATLQPINWEYEFAALNRNRKILLSGRRIPFVAYQTITGHRFRRLKRWLHMSSDLFSSTWKGLSDRTRSSMWPELLIVALRGDPANAIRVLECTVSKSLTFPYASGNALNYIILYYLDGPGSSKAFLDRNFGHSVLSILLKTPEISANLLQRTIFLLLANLGDEAVKTLYETLSQSTLLLSPDTLIHFASRAAKSGDLVFVMELLRQIATHNLDFNTPKMMSLSSSILLSSRSASNDHSMYAEAFEFLLGMGLRPNVVTYTILIQNALLVGDVGTAWHLYSILKENGIVPDPHVYSILLNDAKLRRDRPAMRSLLGIVRGTPLQNAYITTDILHSVLLFQQDDDREMKLSLHEKESDQSVFKRMLGLYYKYFDVRPLERLIPDFRLRFPASEYNSVDDDSSTSPKQEPPIPTLVVMLTGLLHGLDARSTKALYKHFLNVTVTRHDILRKLAMNQYVWNIFLLRLGKFEESLYDCPRLVELLVSEETKFATVADGDAVVISKMPLHAPKPDIWTWNILLNTFTEHGQLRAAEKVFDAMTARGMKPTTITYNTLAKGYSRQQNAEMTGKTMARLQKDGLKLDDYARNAMNRILDQRRMIGVMEKEMQAWDVSMDMDFVRGMTEGLVEDHQAEEAYMRRKLRGAV